MVPHDLGHPSSIFVLGFIQPAAQTVRFRPLRNVEPRYWIWWTGGGLGERFDPSALPKQHLPGAFAERHSHHTSPWLRPGCCVFVKSFILSHILMQPSFYVAFSNQT